MSRTTQSRVPSPNPNLVEYLHKTSSVCVPVSLGSTSRASHYTPLDVVNVNWYLPDGPLGSLYPCVNI